MTLAAKVAEYDAELPDWAVAEVLNTPNAALPAKIVDVPVSTARAVLMTSGAWGAICIAAAKDSVPDAVRGLAITARDSMNLLSILEMTKPATKAAVEGMVAGLVAAGLLAQATADELLALASAPQSWAELNNVRVDAREVGLARGSK